MLIKPIKPPIVNLGNFNIPLWAAVFLLLYASSVPLTKPSTQPGVYHQVRPGETLWSIAQAYQVRVQELAGINRIKTPESLEAGSVIFIPGARSVVDKAPKDQPTFSRLPPPAGMSLKEKPPPSLPPSEEIRIGEAPPEGGRLGGSRDDATKPEVRVMPQPPRSREEAELPVDKKRFTWPLRGELKTRFGMQPNGMYFNGIKIAAAEGSPVTAAATGVVIFSSALKDYGETVIIRHDDNFATVYTNLGSRLVKMSDQVKGGDQIAHLENPEKKGSTILNFEIRYKNKAYNPLLFLP
ncbi:MAG: LysM peptidoglycan-binding domain-containing M23 family metallopeptidase [Smithellaceae bacterium]|nr:LysM peptidoglycan-binding domain-containing M23 family metallopeptidase [Smithellaceae bacterium]